MDEGFILEKSIGVGQPKRIENAKILVANTPMDTDKIKIYGARVRVDAIEKVGHTYIHAYMHALDELANSSKKVCFHQCLHLISHTQMVMRSQVASIEAAEKEKMKKKVEAILAHGCNCFTNRQVRMTPFTISCADRGWYCVSKQRVRLLTRS